MVVGWWLHKPTIVEFPRERLHPPDLTNHSLFSPGRKWGCFFLLFLSFILGSFATFAFTSSIFFFKLHFSNLVLSFAQKWKREVFIHSTNSKIAPSLILPQVQTTKGWSKCIQSPRVGLIHPWKSIVINCLFVYQQRKLSHEKIFFRRKSTGNGTRTKQRTSNATRAGFLLR